MHAGCCKKPPSNKSERGHPINRLRLSQAGHGEVSRQWAHYLINSWTTRPRSKSVWVLHFINSVGSKFASGRLKRLWILVYGVFVCTMIQIYGHFGLDQIPD